MGAGPRESAQRGVVVARSRQSEIRRARYQYAGRAAPSLRCHRTLFAADAIECQFREVRAFGARGGRTRDDESARKAVPWLGSGMGRFRSPDGRAVWLE